MPSYVQRTAAILEEDGQIIRRANYAVRDS